MIPCCEPSLQRHREARAVPVAELNSGIPGTPARPSAAEAAARIVRGMGPDPSRMSRRTLLRIGAMVAAYAVERAATEIRGEG